MSRSQFLFKLFVILCLFNVIQSLFPQRFPNNVNPDVLTSTAGNQFKVQRCCVTNCTVMEYVGEFSEGVEWFKGGIADFGYNKAGNNFSACYGTGCLSQAFNASVQSTDGLFAYFPSFRIVIIDRDATDVGNITPTPESILPESFSDLDEMSMDSLIVNVVAPVDTSLALDMLDSRNAAILSMLGKKRRRNILQQQNEFATSNCDSKQGISSCGQLPPCCKQIVVEDDLCSIAEEAGVRCDTLLDFNGERGFEMGETIQVC
eukprot:TRINITY_DN17494_c0_g1_i1.p1 TRINITY_DN17494_c0_g1~~TRINITY_DN17494_c0_g1_i1.p1  ORF type:complete len:294 (-),score=32.19 TRINITY_DN17494_c0_g1_i1:175-957(-)